jgi:hypothetical protein
MAETGQKKKSPGMADVCKHSQCLLQSTCVSEAPVEFLFIYVAYMIPDKKSFFLLESCGHPGTMSNGQLSQCIVALIKTAFDRPGYLNYGGMGAIAAHELTVRSFCESLNLVV